MNTMSRKRHPKNWIKHYRKEEGLTSEQLAEKIGMSAVGLRYIENGERGLSIEKAKQIGDALADMIEDYQKLGLISKQDYKSYIKRIAAISTPALRQRVLIELMLSDPVFRDDRMATSKIDYTDHGLEFLEE